MYKIALVDAVQGFVSAESFLERCIRVALLKILHGLVVDERVVEIYTYGHHGVVGSSVPVAVVVRVALSVLSVGEIVDGGIPHVVHPLTENLLFVFRPSVIFTENLSRICNLPSLQCSYEGIVGVTSDAGDALCILVEQVDSLLCTCFGQLSLGSVRRIVHEFPVYGLDVAHTEVSFGVCEVLCSFASDDGVALYGTEPVVVFLEHQVCRKSIPCLSYLRIASILNLFVYSVEVGLCVQTSWMIELCVCNGCKHQHQLRHNHLRGV